jgi:iron complex outermembrane receptor protein
LYASQAHAVTGNGTRDPIKCPAFDANNPSCSFQFTTITGGNPGLSPEHSTTFTLGTIIEPVHNLTLDVDAFWIFLRNQIVVGGLGYATILQNAQTATEFATLIQRDAQANIVAISQTNANLFKTNLSGIDFDMKYAYDMASFGRLSPLGHGTYSCSTKCRRTRTMPRPPTTSSVDTTSVMGIRAAGSCTSISITRCRSERSCAGLIFVRQCISIACLW